MAKKKVNTQNASVEDKLRLLFELQSIDTKIEEIKKLRGELPLEVEDLEDEVQGLQTRITKLEEELAEIAKNISHKKIEIKEASTLIAKYTDQQQNVRNNREFNTLSKEIEFKNLEIELAEKKEKEFKKFEETKTEQLETTKLNCTEKTTALNEKKGELEEIIAETQKEEDALIAKSEKFKGNIEERLVTAYTRIKDNARNGLAVVTVSRDACGGCFNKIPPQRHLDIRSRKKIIVCEYCGRILVDKYINDLDNSQEKADKEASSARTTRRKRRTATKK